MMEKFNSWNLIYEQFDPVAFEIFNFSVHWYGIAYVLALLSALFLAKFFVKRDPKRFNLSAKNLESFFIWAEIGVILGARIGYIFIYDPNAYWYFTHPWQIFNPFDPSGNFVGIRGMSYHGALIGFLAASYGFARRYKISFFMLLDLIALCVPLAYVFGRIGNFLNQELYGRIIPESSLWKPFGILVDSSLRYPSQLIEAFLEGIVVFIFIFLLKKITKTQGLLIVGYGFSYSLARFVSEYFREPDLQLGTYALNLSMGQILSLVMAFLTMLIFIYVMKFKKT